MMKWHRAWRAIILCQSSLAASVSKTFLDSLSTLSVGDAFSISGVLDSQGWVYEALNAAELLQQQGIQIPRDHAHQLLRECTKKPNLECTRRLLLLLAQSGLDSIEIMANHLIRLFAACGSLDEAHQAFIKVSKPSHYTWTAIISAHVKLGEGQTALQLYDEMLVSGLKSSPYIYVTVLQACIASSNLHQGRNVHKDIVNDHFQSDVFVGSTLVDMYLKCGSLMEACEAFSELSNLNVVSWGAMIAGYTQHGQSILALECYEKMQDEGLHPERAIYLSVLKACGRVRAIDQGKRIHARVIQIGLQFDSSVGNTLVDMYGKCGTLEDAHNIFIRMPDHNLISWNAMIAGYAQHGEGLSAVNVFQSMQDNNIEADKFTLSSVLKACGNCLALDYGRKIHDQAVKSGFHCDAFVGSALVDMYARCGALDEAQKVLMNLPNRDIVSWGAMIAGYVQQEQGIFALNCFDKMLKDGIEPNEVILSSVLKACGSVGDIGRGRNIHMQIVKGDLEGDTLLGIALVDMYARCGSLKEAQQVFDKFPKRDVLGWGTLIAAYVQNGKIHSALETYNKMQEDGVRPDLFIFLNVLKACSMIENLKMGTSIHEDIKRNGLESDVCIGSMLVDMYSRCGSLDEACNVFEQFPDRDLALWGAMISGYALHGEGSLALQCFDMMRSQGIKPDSGTFSSILKACGSIGAIGRGRSIHGQIVEGGLISDAFVMNTLVDMYAKCGSLSEAKQIFDDLLDPDVVSWNAMIAAYAQRGDFHSALKYFKDMQQGGIKPNDVTFIIILVACSHAGLLDEGHKYFKSMIEDHKLIPNLSHCASVVDLFSRAGYLNEAQGLLQTIRPYIIGWMCLLTACRKYSNVELGRKCFDHIIQLDPYYAAAYVLMAGIYLDTHMWKDASNVEGLRQHFGAWKKPAKAWIEIEDKVHEFVVGDKNHPEIEEIHAMLKSMSNRMKQAGYMPKVHQVLQKMSDTDKEDALCGHSEKLAVAFGLLKTPSGTTIRATKNLRMCLDCHSATKFLSRIEKRDIIIKDGYCTHWFKDGSCSCGDYYW